MQCFTLLNNNLKSKYDFPTSLYSQVCLYRSNNSYWQTKCDCSGVFGNVLMSQDRCGTLKKPGPQRFSNSL